MESYNKDTATEVKPKNDFTGSNRNGRVMGGMFIIVIGLLVLAHRAGADLPHWLFSFETLLIAIGFYIGLRHSFKGFGWLIPVVIGTLLLVDDFYYDFELRRYWWPIMIIGFGLYIMFKPKKNGTLRRNWGNTDGSSPISSEDFIDSTVVFGSVKKNVISKSFKGGDCVNVFGGTEINLMQADIEGRVVLDLTMVFGGSKLIIPAHWRVQSEELVTIFGGIEDKRPVLADTSTVDQTKMIVLRGTCIFGGIDIKSY